MQTILADFKKNGVLERGKYPTEGSEKMKSYLIV